MAQPPQAAYPTRPLEADSRAARRAVVADAAPFAGNLEELDARAIRKALDENGGNVSAASRQLGISRNTLYHASLGGSDLNVRRARAGGGHEGQQVRCYPAEL